MGNQNYVTEGVCYFFKNQDLQCKRRNIKNVPFLLAGFKTFHLTGGYQPEEFHFDWTEKSKEQRGQRN